MSVFKAKEVNLNKGINFFKSRIPFGMDQVAVIGTPMSTEGGGPRYAWMLISAHFARTNPLQSSADGDNALRSAGLINKTNNQQHLRQRLCTVIKMCAVDF